MKKLLIWLIATATFAISLAAMADALSVTRYYLPTKPNGGWHFYTSNPNEVPGGWAREGEAFRLFPSGTFGTVPLHRFYSNQYGHFYTVDPSKERLSGFTEEASPGNVLTTQAPGSVPLYQRIKPNSNHLFSTNVNEGAWLTLEKTCCYVIPSGASMASVALPAPIPSQDNSGCMDVPGGNFKSGQVLQTYSCNSSAAQNFSWTAAGEIVIGGLCVDAYGGGSHVGDQIGLFTCNTGAKNQHWIFKGYHIVGGGSPPLASYGPRSPGVGSTPQAVCISRDHGKLYLRTCNNDAGQLWLTPPVAPVAVVNQAKLYVIDGTQVDQNKFSVMWNFMNRFQGLKEYWSGPSLEGANSEAIYRDVLALVCQEKSPKVFLAGYSRGAIVALTVANEARKQCGLNVAFVGLLDPVNTSMFGYSVALNPGVPVAIEIEKPFPLLDGPLSTAPISGINIIDTPLTYNLLIPVPKHMDMDCPIDSRPGAYNLNTLIEWAGKAGLQFSPTNFGSHC